MAELPHRGVPAGAGGHDDVRCAGGRVSGGGAGGDAGGSAVVRGAEQVLADGGGLAAVRGVGGGPSCGWHGGRAAAVAGGAAGDAQAEDGADPGVHPV